MYMKKLVLITLLLVLSLICFVQNKPTPITPIHKIGLSREEVLRIAIKEGKRERLNLIYRTILFDVDNKYWKEKLKTIQEVDAQDYKFLESKDYQAVCFAPVEILNSKNVWVLIDKKTGEVLKLYKE